MLDPRQQLCWEYYATPGSETFGNALRSAIKAGYEPKTANRITVQPWFIGKLRRLGLLAKAEKVLEEMLDLPVQVIKIDRSKRPLSVADEEDEDVMEEVLYVEIEPALVKIKQDTAKFIAERQGKDQGYSTRTEQTGKNGGAIQHSVVGFNFIKNV